MITALYASILSLLMCGLSLNVIKIRRKNRIKYSDGGLKELQIARAAHSNTVDYIPIVLILFFFLELNSGNLWLLHITGSIFFSGRLIHAWGILSEKLAGRILGMQITIAIIIALALLNLVYLPYEKILYL